MDHRFERFLEAYGEVYANELYRYAQRLSGENKKTIKHNFDIESIQKGYMEMGSLKQEESYWEQWQKSLRNKLSNEYIKKEVI